MKMEKEGKPLAEIRRTIEARYNEHDGHDTKTQWPPQAKGTARTNSHGCHGPGAKKESTECVMSEVEEV